MSDGERRILVEENTKKFITPLISNIFAKPPKIEKFKNAYNLTLFSLQDFTPSRFAKLSIMGYFTCFWGKTLFRS